MCWVEGVGCVVRGRLGVCAGWKGWCVVQGVRLGVWLGVWLGEVGCGAGCMTGWKGWVCG